jgi:SHS2 domain-containing protein
MRAQPAGYREVEHTADWELEVWAPDLAGLLEQAAEAMYRLMGVELAAAGPIERRLELEADDPESLLVGFLGELLYLAESEGVAFDRLRLELDGNRATARLTGAAIASQSKEIKAVTYHRLAITTTGRGVETRVVFDV